jgi:hypothetical protein
MTIRRMWAELIHEDRQGESNSPFRNFVNARKNDQAFIDAWKARMKRCVTVDEVSLQAGNM